MPRMPRQCRENIFDGQAAALAMTQLARPLLGRQRFKEQYGAGVDTFENAQRRLDGAGAAVRKLGPKILVEGLDGGIVFGQGQLGAEIPIEMRVRKVVDHLTDGPAALAVASIQLFFGKVRYRSP